MIFDTDQTEALQAEAVWGGFARQQAVFRRELEQKPKQKRQIMHYKNGREAKNGDKVVLLPQWGPPVAGILYDAVAGNDTCNGKIAITSQSDPCPNLAECLHFDDLKAAMAAGNVPVALPPTV